MREQGKMTDRRRGKVFKADRRKHRRRRNRQETLYETHSENRELRHRRKKKLPGWAILPILAGVTLICFGASKVFGEDTKSTQLRVVKARKESVKEIYNTSGTVVSEKSKTFYSPVNAPVKKNKAKVGEAVKKGDTLITFDTTNLNRDNQTSRLNTLSAQYTNQDVKEQSGRAKKSAEKAKKQEKTMISELNSQIEKKQSEIKKLEKQVRDTTKKSSEIAGRNQDIQKKMKENLDNQSICKAKKENAERQLENMDDSSEESGDLKVQYVKEAEDATNEISRLEREYRTLEQESEQLGGGAGADSSTAAQSLAQAKQELESLKSSLTQAKSSSQTSAETTPTDAQLKNMKVSEDLAQLAELTAKELLQKGEEGIKAEFDGIISDVKTAEGSDAVQGGELFTLVSNQDVCVELEVSAGDFDNLITGNKAVITIGRRIYHGTLKSVNKIAIANEKGNPVIGAKLQIDDPDEDIYIGVSAKVNLTVAEKDDVLCLPNEVINTASDGDFVYIIKDGTVRKRKVEVGVASSGMSEIVFGISEGDEVISEMSDDIKEGMKATGIEDEESETVGGKSSDSEDTGEE